MKEERDVYILSNTLKTGGAEKQSILLAKQLASKFSVKLVIYYGNEADSRYLKLVEEYKIDVLYLKGSHQSKIYQLLKLFWKKKDAVVFSYLATTNLLNAIVGLISGIKWRIGGIRNSKLSRKKLFLQRFLHNHVLKASIFNNHSGFKELQKKGFSSGKAYVIPNCIQVKQPPRKEFNSKSEVNILTVSRFVPQKDYLTALNSISYLQDNIRSIKDLDFKYTIVGFGELEDQIRDIIDQKGLSEKVDLIINPVDVKKYFNSADIYLSTSLFEGLSNSIMEAMEYSLPVIATDVGDNSKLVRHNKTGYLTEVAESQKIAGYLIELINNVEKRHEMGSEGYKLLKNEYSEQVFKERYLKFIEELINE